MNLTMEIQFPNWKIIGNWFSLGNFSEVPHGFSHEKNGGKTDFNVPLNQSNEPTVLQGFVLDLS